MISLSSSIENECRAHTGSTSSHEDAVRDAEEERDMYEQMWQASAGVLAYVPKVGELVVYFPQGHIEQVEPYVSRDSEMEMPIYELPSEIPCRVLDVQLKVELQDDEVFARITLLPVSKQDEAGSYFENTSSARVLRNKPQIHCKILTLSDSSMHGGFSLPKRLADECLPPLDMLQQPPSQEVVMKDLHGFPWHLRHIYQAEETFADDWLECVRHFEEAGCRRHLHIPEITAEDSNWQPRRGRNGDLRIGIRHSAKSRTNLSPSVISSHTMQHGILANAFLATTSGSMFTIYYRPWTCPSCFIVPLDRYMVSEMKDYFAGKKFKMQFEDDAGGEQRFGGTITGVEDIDPIRWPGSKWRCIKVRWDSVPDEHSLPERISPWDAELTVPNKQKQSFPPTPSKRICIGNLFQKRPPVIADGFRRAGVEALHDPTQGVFQGQEIKQNLLRDLFTTYPKKSPVKPTSQNFSTRLPSNPGKLIPPKRTNDRTDPDLCVNDRLFPVVGHMKLECHEYEAPRAEDNNDEAPPSRRKEIMVFGVNLVETLWELPSQQAAGRGEY